MNDFAKQLQLNILSLTVVLLAVGLVMVYSTSSVVAQMDQATDNAYFFIKKQLLWILIAAAAMLACMDVSLTHLKRYGYWIFAAVLVLLVLVLIPGIGSKYNGARRWIRIAGFGCQPSDFMKLATVILVATYVEHNFHKLKHFFAGFLPVFSVIAVACLLILMEPDFGTCCFVFTLAMAMLLVSGIRWRHLAMLSLAGLPIVAIFAFMKFSHIRARVAIYLNPELDPLGKGYQIRQSLIALGSGGNLGTGLGGSQQKLFFLSEESTDFIFAIIGEELGFLGTSSVVLLFILFAYYGLKVVRYAPDTFSSLLAFGITFSISLQAIFNIAVVTQTVPAKGISLPFISFGGSGILTSLMAVGLLLNVAGKCNEPQTKERIPCIASPTNLRLS